MSRPDTYRTAVDRDTIDANEIRVTPTYQPHTPACERSEFAARTPSCTPACEVHGREIPGSVSFGDIAINRHRSSRDSIQTTPHDRLVIKETVLISMTFISVIVLVSCFVLVGMYPNCEITGVCSSIILSVLSSWSTLLGSHRFLKNKPN